MFNPKRFPLSEAAAGSGVVGIRRSTQGNTKFSQRLPGKCLVPKVQYTRDNVTKEIFLSREENPNNLKDYDKYSGLKDTANKRQNL